MKPPPAPEARTHDHDTNNRTPLTPGQPGDEQWPAHLETRSGQAGPGFGQVEPKSDLAALGSGQTTVGFGTAAPGAGSVAPAHGQAHRGPVRRSGSGSGSLNRDPAPPSLRPARPDQRPAAPSRNPGGTSRFRTP
ncbi:hypothetical protein QBB34_11305 [Streptomyces stelliscabiei]|uniref:hypothetical protein n=1 Tax=Streptomyces stelliscabiei TaxID=146820 RepID=UPI002FF10F1C